MRGYPARIVHCSVYSAGSHKEVAMQMMGRIGVMGLGIALAGALVGAPVEDGSKVVIMSPKDGDKVSDTFEVKYDLTKGSQATHVHAYVDGEYQKGFAGEIKSLNRGTHKVTITGATKDHDPVVASHSITVDVQ